MTKPGAEADAALQNFEEKIRAMAADGLDAKRRHLVRIRDGKKTIESFHFTFASRGGRSLCLSYGPFYETWDLSPPGRRPWCKCK